MKTEAKYRIGLQELIKKTPLDEINVTMLCEHVKSNRQTFYYHFRDISDVVESVLLEDRIGYNKNDNDFEAILKTAIAYINSHYSFLASVNKSFASDKIYQLFYSFFYKKIHQIIKKHKKSSTIDAHTASFINRAVSSLFSHELCFWMSNKLKENPVSLTKRLTTVADYYYNRLPQELLKKD